MRAAGCLEPGSELPEQGFDARPLWVLLARCLDYKERWRRRAMRHCHINVLELRAHLMEERRVSQQFSHRRCLYGLDSQVALGAIVKGRAASRCLNRELMKSLPHIIGSDLYGSYMYFPSKLNRADGPTRNDVPAEADVSLPDWWVTAAGGDFSGLDAWIEAAERDVDYKEFDCSALLRPLKLTEKPQHRIPSRMRNRVFEDPRDSVSIAREPRTQTAASFVKKQLIC